MTRVFLVYYILTSVCTLLKLNALYIGVTSTTSNSLLVRLKRWFLMLNVLLPITCLFFLRGEEIAQIGQYKYLGVHIDNKLSWNVHVHVHVHSVCSKVHQRLYFLQRLRAFGVDEKILVLFYRSIIESILRYGITAWFGNLSVQLKSQLSCLMRTAMKLTGSTSPFRRFLNRH